MTKIRIAVVGVGRIAPAHLRAVVNNGDMAELAMVVGVPQEAARVEELKLAYGATSHSLDYDSMLSDPTISGVILTVPNHLHCSFAVSALDAGKHVLVEKPLATSLPDADAMVLAAEKANRVLMVGQCRRFFRGAQEAKARINDLGRPLDIIHLLGVSVEEAPTEWWRSNATSGGLATALNGPHVVDTMLCFIGGRPKTVYSQSSRLKPEKWEGEDESTIVMSFEDGSVATGHLSFNANPEVNERWIIGPKGTMRLSDDRTLWANSDLVVREEKTPYLLGDVSFDAQCREFLSAIAEGRKPLADAREVRDVVATIEAAQESARLGKPIVLSDERVVVA